MTDKIRTTTQLSERLDEEIVWRKRELRFIKSLVDQNQNKPREATLIRSGVTLLYAHWEGFVKNAATAYIEFVNRQNLKYEELADNFVALAMKRKLGDAQETNKATKFTEVAVFFRSGLSEQSSIQWKNAIDTESNLSSVVLREIICTIGLDYSIYETKKELLDSTLLNSRNKIAHGERLLIDCDTYNQLHKEIIALMDLLLNQIDNAAYTKAYLYSHTAPVPPVP